MAAYGDIKHVIEYLNPKDIVFYCHKRVGVIAAAEVTGPPRSEDDKDEEYRDVRFLTPVPSRDKGIQRERAMTAAQVSQVTERTFFWARTIKFPYLDQNEGQKLLTELNHVLANHT